jgi:cephalosporin-C deacetylase-like acetyl esterase
MRNGYGHMMIDHMIERMRAIRADRDARLAAVRTRDDALAYQARCRKAVRAACSPVPERTPLNARVVGAIQRRDCTIERVIYESRPGLLVTANLYIPSRLDAPAPCVLGTCGHSANGKAIDLYQGFCLRLVRNGFVVPIYDPINQGERDQYALLQDRESVSRSTWAHNMMGKQLELTNDWFGMWRAWDGIRSLDYLLSRPEVDPSRVGVTGNSGGGTMSSWLWAFEERFTMAAPSCFITTFLHNLENELPADSEQYPPGVIGQGMEMADLLMAAAPKPIMLLGKSYDYFDRRGHDEAYHDLVRFYQAMGAPAENLGIYRDEGPHGYSAGNQNEMVAFFGRHAGVETHPIDEVPLEEEAALLCAPDGQVMAAGNRPVYAFIGERAHGLAKTRPALRGDALRAKLAGLLHLPEREGAPHHRNLRTVHQTDATYGRYAVETEGNVRAILRKRMGHAERGNSLDVEPTVHLILPHASAEQALPGEAWAQEIAGDVYALDVRGMGESQPDDDGPSGSPYGVDYMMHGYYLLLGESYLGRRVFDVLRTIDLLEAHGAEEIVLYGRGNGALLAMFVALLDDRVSHVTLKGGPGSYTEMATAPITGWASSCFLRGILLDLDLDDCLAELGDRATVH